MTSILQSPMRVIAPSLEVFLPVSVSIEDNNIVRDDLRAHDDSVEDSIEEPAWRKDRLEFIWRCAHGVLVGTFDAQSQCGWTGADCIDPQGRNGRNRVDCNTVRPEGQPDYKPIRISPNMWID